LFNGEKRERDKGMRGIKRKGTTVEEIITV
jgi:hypothetical protein